MMYLPGDKLRVTYDDVSMKSVVQMQKRNDKLGPSDNILM